MKMNKVCQFEELIMICRSFVYSPTELSYRKKSYKNMQKIVAKQTE